jgi:2-succinyl-5-enolpyruvyl-6-hydroxy-3-cyclohexene-1-carboxylate synthase
LRILVINNQGGGIFHILKGPSEHPGFKKFIEAYHPVNIAKLAEAYGLQYLYADNETSFDDQWQHFTGKQKAAVVFEVKTDAVISAKAFRKLMVSS